MQQTGQADFTPYQTDALFLLVGKNPLPNYVAARLLLTPDGTLYLVHSQGPQGTGGVAQQLAAHFSQHQPQLIPVNPRNTASLIREVNRYLERTPPGPIGLNYTGGTKIMAVHSYQAVEEFCERRGRKGIFSYLDADALEMAVESPPGQQIFRENVAHTVQLSLKDVFDLHGIRLQGDPQTEPVLPDLAYALAEMHGTPAGIQAWQNSRQIFKELVKVRNSHPWQEVKANLLGVGATPDAIGHLEQALGLQGSQPVDFRAAARKAKMKSSRELLLWLDGAWLEHWSLDCVKALGYTERARSLERQAGRMFEIDVAVMHGYLLFALSCTVTTKARTAKLKFFEVYNRARQLGGDEARAGLVCAIEDPKALEMDIIRTWDARDRIKVFGRGHLPDLQKHLKSWFETV